MSDLDKKTLEFIASELKRGGATIPAPQPTGTVEGAMKRGLCLALMIVEMEILKCAKKSEPQAYSVIPEGWKDHWQTNVMRLWSCARKHDSFIPDEQLDFMRDYLLMAGSSAPAPHGNLFSNDFLRWNFILENAKPREFPSETEEQKAERRELLEMSAKAACVKDNFSCWNPLDNNSHAIMLLAKLRMTVGSDDVFVRAETQKNGFTLVPLSGDPQKDIRLAITIMAAKIGRAMP
jgi:hypothetical protein